MQPLPDEQQLISRAKQGDKNAISTLYRVYVQAIFRYISYRVESDTVAEDLTGEVFLHMVQALPRYQQTQAPLGAWLFRIAANQVADHYRRKRRAPSEPILDSQPDDAADPFGRMEDEEERAQLRAALQALPEDYQTLLILRFMQQLPHSEVAAVMRKSEAAIRVMQHRALKALAKAIGSPTKARGYLRGEET
jgi:RNA polymerase sigma-70 factor (ECF subfamily)